VVDHRNEQRSFGCPTRQSAPPARSTFDVGTQRLSPVSEFFHVNANQTYNQKQIKRLRDSIRPNRRGECGCNAIGQWGRQVRQSGRRTLLFNYRGARQLPATLSVPKPITNYSRYSGGPRSRRLRRTRLTPRITSQPRTPSRHLGDWTLAEPAAVPSLSKSIPNGAQPKEIATGEHAVHRNLVARQPRQTVTVPLRYGDGSAIRLRLGGRCGPVSIMWRAKQR